MALPKNISDLEMNKFAEDASGNVCLRTIISTLDIQIGAVEIKNYDSDVRQGVNTSHEALVKNPPLEVLFGEVQASPTANTLLDRLKTIASAQLPDDHNVTISNVSLAVTGTFYQTTQPVSGTFWQTTQPVSIASIPLAATAATSAKQLADGHNVALSPIVKTIPSELLAITTISADTQQKSSELDIGSIDRATVFIDHARDVATAFVGAGTEYTIEVSEKATGNDTWRTLYSVVCGIAAASSIVMDEEEPAAETEIKTGATLPAAGNIVFFKNGTLGNSEWGKVIAIDASGGTEHFDIQDGLTNAQAAITLYNKAEQFVLNIDLKTAKRLRVVVNNNNGTTNQNIVSRIACITS